MYLFINIPIHLYISVCCVKEVGFSLFSKKQTKKQRTKTPKPTRKLTQPGWGK